MSQQHDASALSGTKAAGKQMMTLSAALYSISSIAPFVQAFFEDRALPARLAPRVTLALEELLANVAHHGRPGGPAPMVTIRLWTTNTHIEAEFIDSGIAYNPLNRPDPVLSDNVNDRPVGGLGVYLVRRIMQQVQYRRDGDRNHLRFCAALTA